MRLILLCQITWCIFSEIVIPAWIAGIQAPWMGLSLTSMEPGYPLPGGYDELKHNLTK